MTDANKTAIRKEFAKQLLNAEMSQSQLEDYMKSDMDRTPEEFMAQEGVTDEEFNEYLDDEFPKKK